MEPSGLNRSLASELSLSLHCRATQLSRQIAMNLSHLRKKGRSMSEQFRVMLVDDDEDTQKIFRVVMQHYQLPLEIFTDAESALERLKEKPDPDVMVIDIVLPGIDGYQMLGRSRILAPD